jgi:hypothetical protein
LPANDGLAVTQNLSAFRIERTMTPTEREFPTLGVIGFGAMTPMAHLSPAPPSSTPATEPRDAEPPIIYASRELPVRGADESMVFTSMQVRSTGARRPFARGPSAPEVMRDHASAGDTIPVDRSGQLVAEEPSTRRDHSGGGSSFSPDPRDGLSIDMPRTDLPLTMVSRRRDTSVPFVTTGAAGAKRTVAMPLAVARAGSLGPTVYDHPAATLMSGNEPSVDVSPGSDTPARTDAHGSEVDADEIVERTWREVMSRLAIEQERRGFGRWA